MSLDKNLFTLAFTPHKDNPNVIDLTDPSGTVHYRKQRVTGTAEYKIEVYDPTSESLLATAYAPTATSKLKTIELCNPTCTVELKYTGTYSFKWSFKWEEHELEWKREECFIIRKPDPPVIVSITKEPTGRLKTTTVQILDYNLNRFDIDDRKGLEIVILTALLTFSDANEAAHLSEPGVSNKAVSRKTSAAPPVASPVTELPPPTPPKPAPKTGVERIAEMQAVKGEYNEIIISDEGSVADYAQYCNRLLQDDAMLFVSVKSADADQVPKVLQVVEEAKRIRYKAGLDEEEGLHQYVLYDQKEQRKGPRIINLDDNKKNKYAPPKNLTVHLSKISMPELQPKAVGNDKQNNKNSSNKKEDKKAASSPPANQRPKPPPASGASPNGSPSNIPAVKVQRPPQNKVNPQPPKYPVDSKTQAPPRYPVDTKTPIPPQSRYPADSKQPMPPPVQYSNPPIYNPRPHKKTPSSGEPDGFYPRPSSSGRPPAAAAPQAGPSNSNQYLRPASPMPGAWPGTSPSRTPPPPSYENGDYKHTIAQGASTVVHGFLGLISNGKK